MKKSLTDIKVSKTPLEPMGPPATNPDSREKELISLAVNLAEEQLRNGPASSQVITHFLKLGSTKERLEKEIMEKQVGFIQAKTEALQTAKKIEELYDSALAAMRDYNGVGDDI